MRSTNLRLYLLHKQLSALAHATILLLSFISSGDENRKKLRMM